MTHENPSVTTRMRFIPDKNVHTLLKALLDPFLVERLARVRQPLAFYSIHAYIAESAASDMTLRRFMKNTDDRVLPYDSMTFDAWTVPGADDMPSQGVAINVEVDTQGLSDVAWDAEQLGFCNQSKRIMARLTLAQDNLKDGIFDRTKALRLKDYVNSGEEEAFVEMIQTDLT